MNQVSLFPKGMDYASGWSGSQNSNVVSGSHIENTKFEA